MDNKETIESRTISELYYSTDIEGNLYGAEDFTVDGSTIYVLNSSNNTVLKYKDQLLADTIDVDAFGITAILISADNGGLYILGTDLSVVKISDEGTVTSRNYAEFIGDEAITDFIVDEGKMYISTPEGDYDTTYVFDSSSYAAEDAIDIFDGRYFDKGIIYTVDKVGENKSFSNICIVTVFNGDFVDKYTLTSDYLITGAVFLGYDENKNALIKVIEACSDENYKIVSSETIRTISESGDVIMISEVPN